MKRFDAVLNKIQKSGDKKYRLIRSSHKSDEACNGCCFVGKGEFGCSRPDNLEHCAIFNGTINLNCIYEEIKL